MTAPVPSRRGQARVFAAGAAAGFVAGAFVLAAVVWQYGNVIGSRSASLQHPPQARAAVERWTPEPGEDMDSPIIEAGDAPAATGTSGGPAPSAPPPEARIGVPADSPSELANRKLVIPVDGITADQLVRTFDEERSGSRQHQAIDILAPRNTPVRAVEDGVIARLFTSRAGGVTIYQFDPTGRYCYYYAHLERYADGLKEGAAVRKGDLLGYVGTSGNAPKDTPHLHFAVFRLTADKRWWEGTPLDPYDILR